MKHYCLNCGKELAEKQYICPNCHHNVYLDSLDDKMISSSSSVLSAINIEMNTQWARYHCGKDGSTGHGFAAEDYNAFCDKRSGADVYYSGRGNAKNGADRMVDGIYIQVKYCSTPQSTVNAAFSDNGQGVYRYYADGKPQILEVPADQYDRCVALMEQKIKNGQVDGVSDPNDAKNIVRKGSCSYAQAKNIARAGNIDSLLFDVKTGAVIALSSLGVAFSVKLCMAALTCKNMEDFKVAIQLSFLEGLKSGTITFSTSVFTTQVVRTQFGRKFVAFAQHASKNSIDSIYNNGIGQKMVHDIASGLWNKTLTGVSAKNVVVKLVRVNAVTNVATFLITSVPDTYQFLVSKKISGPQFIKNLVVNATSITGATIGGVLGLRFGHPGAVAGSMIGGCIAGILNKTIADKISKDDSEYMQELIKIALLELSNEYAMQSQNEFDTVIRNIGIDGAIDTNLLKAMYQAGVDTNDDILRVALAKIKLAYQFEVVARQRPQIKIMGKEQLILESINSIDLSFPAPSNG